MRAARGALASVVPTESEADWVVLVEVDESALDQRDDPSSGFDTHDASATQAMRMDFFIVRGV